MKWFKSLLGNTNSVESAAYRTLLEESRLYLEQHTELLRCTWQFGQHKKWHFDQVTGHLKFFFEDGREVVCPAQAVGDFGTQDKMWAWAWCNPSIGEHLRVEVEKVRVYGEEHQIEKLAQSAWKATLQDSWDMVAIAAHLCEYPGAFCSTAGPMHVFLMFREVQLDRFELS